MKYLKRITVIVLMTALSLLFSYHPSFGSILLPYVSDTVTTVFEFLGQLITQTPIKCASVPPTSWDGSYDDSDSDSIFTKRRGDPEAFNKLLTEKQKTALTLACFGFGAFVL